MTQELHITTERCELMDGGAKGIHNYCISCRCWFNVKTCEVLSLYATSGVAGFKWNVAPPDDFQKAAIRAGIHRSERMLDELRNHHPPTPASVAG